MAGLTFQQLQAMGTITHPTDSTSTGGMTFGQLTQKNKPPAPPKQSFWGNLLQPTDITKTSGLGTVGEEALNIGKSLVKNVAGMITYPIQAVKTAAQLPGEAVGAVKDVGVKKLVTEAPVGLAKAAYKVLAPEAVQKTFSGGLEQGLKSLSEDPFQLLPYALMGEGVKGKIPGVEKAAAPFEKSYSPEAAKAFQEQGIKPPVSAVTKSPFVKSVEALVSKGIFGEKIVNDIVNVKNTIESRINETVSKLTPEKIMSDENIGKTIQEGLKDYEANFKQTSNKVYDAFLDKYAKSKATLDNTIKVGREIVNQQTKDLYRGVDNKILNFVKEIGRPRNPKVYSFENLKATKESIGEALVKNPESTALKRLYGALSEDMNNTVSAVDKGAGSVLKGITQAYKNGKQQIESNIASSIEKSNPERIAQNIIKRNSADTLKTLKGMIGKEKFGEISKSFVKSLFDNSVTRGAFDVSKFTSNLLKYDKETLAEVISPEKMAELDKGIEQLKKLDKLGEYLKPSEKIAQGSQTAYLARAGQVVGGLSAFTTAVLTGNWGAAIGLLSAIPVEYGATKLFTSDIGQKYLTEGLPVKSTYNIPKGTILPIKKDDQSK